MFRKVALSALAVAALGMGSLASTPADAGFKVHIGHHHHAHKRIYVGAPVVYAGYHSCWVKRWVATPHGPRLKKVYVCY
jgi:hypothetical protein